MLFPLIHFLHERGPRPAATKEEATALQYIENLFRESGLETTRLAFTSFGGTEWYYTICYLLFPLAAMVYLENTFAAFLLVTLAMLLLRLDLIIWPILNRFLAVTSRSRTVVGRVHATDSPDYTVVVSANADSRRILPLFLKRPIAERIAARMMQIVDFLRLIHWFLYLLALVFTLLNMRDQVQLIWRLSWVPSLLSLLTAGYYVAQALHGTAPSCANDNLTGLQVLVDLAAFFSKQPCQRTELVFAATGAGRAGSIGMYHLMRTLKPKPEATLCVHLTALGSGKVSMIGSEGWTRAIYASEVLTGLGYLIGSTMQQPLEVSMVRQRRSDAAMARTLGYQAMALTGLLPIGVPPHLVSEEQLKADNLAHATDCLIEMLRTHDQQV